MNHKLPLSENISRAIYSMSRFDATFESDHRAMNVFLSYLDDQVKIRAVKVCVDEFITEKDPDKAYDRGYIRGLYELVHFIKKSYAEQHEAHKKESG